MFSGILRGKKDRTQAEDTTNDTRQGDHVADVIGQDLLETYKRNFFNLLWVVERLERDRKPSIVELKNRENELRTAHEKGNEKEINRAKSSLREETQYLKGRQDFLDEIQAEIKRQTAKLQELVDRNFAPLRGVNRDMKQQMENRTTEILGKIGR